MPTFEEQLAELDSVEAMVDKIVNAANVPLFDTDFLNGGVELKVAIRSAILDQITDDRVVNIILNLAKVQVDALRLDAIRDTLRIQTKQYLLTKAQALQPDTDEHKTRVDGIIAALESDPDITG